MKTRRTRVAISEVARQAGAAPHSHWPQSLFRALRRKWKSRKPAAGLVMFAGEDAPRNLDDPLSDPKVQARFGEAIGSQGKRHRRGRND